MSWLVSHIDNLDNRNAITDPTGTYTYSELSFKVRSFQKETERQIAPGEVVVILSDYNFYSIALFIALLNKKCIIVPIVSHVNSEINNKIEIASGKKIIKITPSGQLKIDANKQNKTHALTADLIAKNQAGLILYSSGSTGKPKAMIHNLDVLVDSFNGKKLKKLNILVFLMFDHIGGINTLLNTLSMGAHIILPLNRNASEIAALIERYKVNVLPASPTFLNMMLMDNVSKKYDLSSLKMITYGTESMPESLLKRLKVCFPKARLLQTFGTSETGIMKTTSKSSDSLEMKLDDPNQEYKVVDGELWLRSKTQVLGYLNTKMDSFTQDGWFQTGDLVDELKDGYIRIIGRKNDVINVGGEKVLPSEVESILMEMEIVMDAIVYGASNSITGQSVVADIVLVDLTDSKSVKKDIRSHCRLRLSVFKIPTKINFIKKANISDRFKKLRS